MPAIANPSALGDKKAHPLPTPSLRLNVDAAARQVPSIQLRERPLGARAMGDGGPQKPALRVAMRLVLKVKMRRRISLLIYFRRPLL